MFKETNDKETTNKCDNISAPDPWRHLHADTFTMSDHTWYNDGCVILHTRTDSYITLDRE